MNKTPTKISTFCNRENETKRLKENIAANKHTAVLAPRGYGKTSLIAQALNDTNLLHCKTDFLLAATPNAVQKCILDKTGKLLFSFLPKTKKTKEKILNIFRVFRPEISPSNVENKIILHAPQNGQEIQSSIHDALMYLDKAAQLVKKHIVIFMDEFQQIAELKDHQLIGAALRDAIEGSQNVTYVFSGSNRHKLSEMFSAKKSPFCQLCATIILKRTREEDQIKFIQEKAVKKWKKPLAESSIREIIKASERHPYYINIICHYLWDQNQMPTSTKIQEFWKTYINNQRPTIAYDISLLSNNQKVVLSEFAHNPTNKPYAQESLLRTRLTIASHKQAINKLTEKDILYVDDMGFTRLLDPAIHSVITKLIQ